MGSFEVDLPHVSFLNGNSGFGSVMRFTALLKSAFEAVDFEPLR